VRLQIGAVIIAGAALSAREFQHRFGPEPLRLKLTARD